MVTKGTTLSSLFFFVDGVMSLFLSKLEAFLIASLTSLALYPLFWRKIARLLVCFSNSVKLEQILLMVSAWL